MRIFFVDELDGPPAEHVGNAAGIDGREGLNPVDEGIHACGRRDMRRQTDGLALESRMPIVG